MAWGAPCMPFKSMPLVNSLCTKESRDIPGCHLLELCYSAKPMLASKHSGAARKGNFKEACVGTGDCRQGWRAGSYSASSL